MPLLDGFEVCEHLKNNLETRHIPIIFLTGESREETIVQGFSLGAADFVQKPFLPAELLARVKTQLALGDAMENEKAYQKKIEEYNFRLSQKVDQQTEELKVAYEQLELLDHSKSEFLSLISHELKTPMNGILGPVTLLIGAKGELSEEDKWISEAFQASYTRLINVVDEAILLTEIELENRLLPKDQISITEIIHQAIEQASKGSVSCNFDVQVPNDFTVSGSTSFLVRALFALVETSCKFSDGQQPVKIHASLQKETKTIQVTSLGYHIPEELLPKFFEIYSIANPLTPNGDLGLKPPIAEKILRLFGGTLTVKNLPQPGVEFLVSLT